jgi:hypothetical protein
MVAPTISRGGRNRRLSDCDRTMTEIAGTVLSEIKTAYGATASRTAPIMGGNRPRAAGVLFSGCF